MVNTSEGSNPFNRMSLSRKGLAMEKWKDPPELPAVKPEPTPWQKTWQWIVGIAGLFISVVAFCCFEAWWREGSHREQKDRARQQQIDAALQKANQYLSDDEKQTGMTAKEFWELRLKLEQNKSK